MASSAGNKREHIEDLIDESIATFTRSAALWSDGDRDGADDGVDMVRDTGGGPDGIMASEQRLRSVLRKDMQQLLDEGLLQFEGRVRALLREQTADLAAKKEYTDSPVMRADVLPRPRAVASPLPAVAEGLTVTLLGCSGLEIADESSGDGPCERYCICKVVGPWTSENKEFRMGVVASDELNPDQNQEVTLSDCSADVTITFRVMRQQVGESDKLLGEATLESSAIRQPGGFEGALELANGGTSHHPLLHVKVAAKTRPFNAVKKTLMQNAAMTSPAKKTDVPEKPKLKTCSQATLNQIDLCEHVVDKLDFQEKKSARTAYNQEKMHKALRWLGDDGLLKNWLLKLDMLWHTMEEPERQGCLATIESSRSLFAFSIGVVLADQVVSILATNYNAANAPTLGPVRRDDLVFCEHLFLGWFVVELILKVFVHRLYFFMGQGWKMNLLDAFLVLYTFVEAVGIDLSFLRALRVFKMAKVVRMLKFASVFQELRLMLDSLLGSFFAMFWAIILIGFLAYMFAIVLVQAMSDQIREGSHDEMDVPDIVKRFGSVESGIISLIMALTGGFDWGELYDLAKDAGEIAQTAMFFLILFFTIAVWNIIGSVYVDKVMAMSAPTEHEKIEQYRAQSAIDISEIQTFLEQLDADKSGILTKREFMRVALAEDLMDFLSDREIDLKDKANAGVFFHMAACRYGGYLDGQDSVAIADIIKMCQHVKGQASLFDIALMKHEIQEEVALIQRNVAGLLQEAMDLVRN